jgi:hypothetical protein
MSVSFETLKELAREPSPGKRNELLRGIAAAFFAAPHRTATEIDLFDEIMDKVLAEVEPLARHELAEHLADVEHAPRRTLVRLAGDVIEVAAPVLMRSPALTDDDLEPIAREQSQDHLLAIAQRHTLSERLTDILVDRGNDNVAGAVTANDGARISQNGFETLAARAEASDLILNRLVMRTDLPDKIADALVPILTRSIDAANAQVPDASAHRLLSDTRTVLADRLRAAVSRARPLTVLNDQVGRGNMSLGEAVAELADADELVPLATFLGSRIGLRSETLTRNLYGATDETLMLICRAAALNVDAFSAILRMRNRRRRGTVAEPARLMKDYMRIPRPMAEVVMRSVRERERVAS